MCRRDFAAQRGELIFLYLLTTNLIIVFVSLYLYLYSCICFFAWIRSDSREGKLTFLHHNRYLLYEGSVDGEKLFSYCICIHIWLDILEVWLFFLNSKYPDELNGVAAGEIRGFKPSVFAINETVSGIFVFVFVFAVVFAVVFMWIRFHRPITGVSWWREQEVEENSEEERNF